MNLRLHHSVEAGSPQPQTEEPPVTTISPPLLPSTNRDHSEPRPFDITTGMQNNQIRWYDPTPGVYISEDPIAFDDSDENLTKYVGQGSSPDHKA